MKNLLTMFVLCFCTFAVTAQELERSAIATSGTSIKNGTAQMDYTIGEVVTLTATNTANPHVTQGFNQTGTSISVNINEPEEAFGITVFPNPVSSSLIIKTDLIDNQKAAYAIYNTLGQITHQGEITSLETRVNLEELASASYYLVITSKEIDFTKTIQFVKH